VGASGIVFGRSVSMTAAAVIEESVRNIGAKDFEID
jgi:hypothetical protein